MRAINPPGAVPPGMSQAMLLTGGNLLVLSGHVALDEKGVVGHDLETQLDYVFRSVEATLRAAGAGFENVARVTIYVRDYVPEMLPAIRAIRARYTNPDCPPASALIGVAALALPELIVEVDALAVLPAKTE